MPIGLATALLAGGQIGTGVYGMLSGRKASKKARKEQKKYLAMALGEYDKLARMYESGGQYGKSLFTDLKRQGEIEVGKTLQQRLMAGIGGTTYGNVYSQYQQNVARPQRLKIEDYLAEKRAEVMRGRAALLGGIQVSGPSESSIAASASGIGAGLGTLAEALQNNQVFRNQTRTSTGTKPKIRSNSEMFMRYGRY